MCETLNLFRINFGLVTPRRLLTRRITKNPLLNRENRLKWRKTRVFNMVPKVLEIPRDATLFSSEFNRLFNLSPRRLWSVGDSSILDGKLLGIISARKTEPDLALKNFELLQQLPSLGATFISGWHSPLEEEALRILLRQPSRIVFCLAKSLDKFIPPAAIADLVSNGRGLLLTHSGPKAKRISRDASLRHNQLVAGLSKGLLVLSAPLGSASLKLARLAINRGRPVFTLQHRINGALISSGALPATIENIRKVFQQT